MSSLLVESVLVHQGCNYGCVAATPDGKELFAVGSDKKLKQFEDSEGAGTQMVKEIDTKVLVTQICLPAGDSSSSKNVSKFEKVINCVSHGVGHETPASPRARAGQGAAA